MRNCDVVVERIDGRNMHGAGGQKTGDKINIPMGLARRRDIESKLCNNLIYSEDSQRYSSVIVVVVAVVVIVIVATATTLKGGSISPNISTGSLSKGASPGPYVLTRSRSMGSATLGASQSHPESSDIPVLKAV